MTTTLTPVQQSIPFLDKYHPNIPARPPTVKHESKIGLKEQADRQLLDDNMSKSNNVPAEQQAEITKRVTSSASNTSRGSRTPTKASMALSPSNGGTSTPRADATMRDDVKTETPSALASDLNGLDVKPPALQESKAIDIPKPAIPDRYNSNSTESSESVFPTSILGGSYGPEGFPLTTNVADDGHQMTTDELQMSAQAAAAIAAADEAIKQLNGTSTVIQGPPGVPSIDNPYSLPRGYANFVKPQARSELRDPGFNAHRQSSTSSSMTEASTSSEESDLCIPGIEWVNVVSPALASNFGTPFGPAQTAKATKSPARMPPPPVSRELASPKGNDRPGLSGRNSSLPLGASAQPRSSGSSGSALPAGIDPNAPTGDDDDEQTVGNGRDRSSSSSSQSTGLDLLWAATQKPGTEDDGPNTDSPYDQSYDSKGKRKAGAEAVAQWRAAGHPVGKVPPATIFTETTAKNGTGPPKKRRRSEIQMEEIDPALRDEQSSYADESGKGMDIEKASNAESDSGESLDSIEDPEYKGDTPQRGRPSGVRSRTTGAGGKKGGRSGGKVAGGTLASNGLSSKGTGKKARKTDSPNRNGGGGGGDGGPGGSKKNGAGPASANVQCEYVNPLPPYNRCQDVFTRKYDLPRHMARHARREGELVFEGKLSEDKALLWKTIKDKPKVVCQNCGESFTRMDALKRHQTKQHSS